MLAALLLATGIGGSCGSSELASGRKQSREALKRVVHWGCQYQKVDEDAIARSGIDMIVLDVSLDDDNRRFVTRDECRRLKRKPDGFRRIVLAYLCVGEVDTKRWYWPPEWRARPPEWVGTENPQWPGSRWVEYWRDEWRSLVFEGPHSILDMILDIGFDGVVLDRVDGFIDWEKSRPTAHLDMVDLVSALALKARAREPAFMVLIQNAEALLANPDLVSVIDGHNKESLLTGLSAPNTYNRSEDVDWSLNYLRKLQQAGVPTFATEYATDRVLMGAVRARLIELGFVPFFGVRALDRLPDDGVERI